MTAIVFKKSNFGIKIRGDSMHTARKNIIKNNIKSNQYVPNTKLCKKRCIFYRELAAAVGVKACHFFLDTGELRRCDPENCDKYCISKKIYKQALKKKRQGWVMGYDSCSAKVEGDIDGSN